MSREDIYKREIAEMQAQSHHLMIRIKEISKENEMLRQQLNECMQSKQKLIDAIEGK